MKIIIDGVSIQVSNEEHNIVEVARSAGIGIPAPCYANNRKGGCCKVCLIEINGEHKYACGTQPKDKMNIIFKRDDLDKIRKNRMIKYLEGESEPCNCNCGSGGDCC
ncbi:MAG: 2Fe-2S iron-sulfur cluster binding domain-containing protein [Candidatus Marinimicrobia bacterium]|nr:2Fe-2S iron-sulfur cluster binding domain-containing protein [Candidatus Neomarinimicrobiota bacterium]